MEPQRRLLILSPRVVILGFLVLYGAILALSLVLVFSGGIVTIFSALFAALAAVGVFNALRRPELWQPAASNQIRAVLGWRQDGSFITRVIDGYSSGLVGPLALMFSLLLFGCCCFIPAAMCIGLV